jgi:membrane protease YdiL (CAAX protease family)
MEMLPPVMLWTYGVLFWAGLVLLYIFYRQHLRRPQAGNRACAWLRSRRWYLHDAAFIVLMLFMLMALAWAFLQVLSHYGGHDLEENVWIVVITQSVVLHWAILVLVWRGTLRNRVYWCGRAAHEWRGAGLGAAAYVATIPVLVLGSLLYSLVLLLLGVEPEMQDVVLLFESLEDGWFFYYFIFMAVILAPIAEELLFRGVLLPACSRAWGVRAGVVVSSLLFAFMHLHATSFAALWLLSVGLAIAYMYTRSIWAPIAMHMLFNGVNLVMVQAGATG